MNILITGGTGFIGRHVVNELKKKHTILCITRKKMISSKKLQYIKSDLINSEKLIKQIKLFSPQILIHLAWDGLPDYGKKNSFRNYRTSKKFLKIILKINSCKKIFIAGSCYEYNFLNGKCKEDSLINKSQYFAIYKLKFFDWLKKSLKKNVDMCWVRIFFAYGPGQKKSSLIPSLKNSLKRRKKINIMYPGNLCDYIYVKDIANFFSKAIFADFKTGVYNLGSSKKYSVKYICKKIMKKNLSKFIKFSYKSRIKNINLYADMGKTKKYFKFIPKTKLLDGIKSV